jgi:hypothetical protein
MNTTALQHQTADWPHQRHPWPSDVVSEGDEAGLTGDAQAAGGRRQPDEAAQQLITLHSSRGITLTCSGQTIQPFYCISVDRISL